MLIYLEHPKHGRKIAYMEAEAVGDESNGWKRYNPDAPLIAEAATPINELRPKATRKEVLA